MIRPLLCLTLLLGACGLLTGPEAASTGAGFSAHASSAGLLLRNDSDVPVHYVALEERTSTLVDLHFDPTQWPRLDAGREARVPYDELMGYEPDAEWAVVYWWTGWTEGGSGRLRVALP